MDNVVLFTGVTSLNLPPNLICKKASERDLSGVLIVGHDEDGELYFASSYADGGHALWLLELAKKRLMEKA